MEGGGLYGIGIGTGWILVLLRVRRFGWGWGVLLGRSLGSAFAWEGLGL